MLLLCVFRFDRFSCSNYCLKFQVIDYVVIVFVEQNDNCPVKVRGEDIRKLKKAPILLLVSDEVDKRYASHLNYFGLVRIFLCKNHRNKAGPEKAAEVDNSVRLLTDSTAVQAKVMRQPV